ncbi:MAG: rhodanese-like domain-containing protein [Cellvibrionaceae bacterium]
MKYCNQFSMAKVLCLTLALLMASVASPLYAAEDIWIDVRTDKEWNSGHLDGAIHIPHTEITGKIVSLTDDKNAPIKLYCRSGGRAGMAKKELEKMGYNNVTNVGGLKDAKKVVKSSE